MTSGGKRQGAGRPPSPDGTAKMSYNTKLRPEVVKYLRQCENAAQAIDEAIRRSKAFRVWRANNF